MNGKKVLSVIKQLGIWGLDESDVCECCNFALFGVNVDVSCRKSEQTIRVHTRHMDSNPNELEAIATEVASQLSGQNYRIRYCDYDQDHPPICCYCGKERADAEAYLCDKCSKRKEATEPYPWLVADR